MAKQLLRGGDKLRKALDDLAKKVARGGTVEAGVFEDATYPDGTPVAQVAQWDEFGTKSAPPRPFMRQTINDNQDKWGADLAKALQATDFDAEKALGIVGERIASQIRDTIREGDFAPNSDLTNLLKDRYPKGDYGTAEFLQAVADLKNGARGGGGKPLVWSGQLLNSIRSQVSDD
ncbi:hypothetical protein ABHV46_10825 [Asaia sp. BMEF1]|uniref:hypothetical protein n=1 Tax=Asaia sp. BMEF1 TaxID=3155932 RepID=UPI003F671B91